MTAMPTPFRLSEQLLTAFVGATDPERARTFYRDMLGLPLVSDELPFALVFDCHGTPLRVTIVERVAAAGYTVLGWRVADITAAVTALRAAGVRFERYQGMRQNAAGIWTSPSGAKVAWFLDPDGNTLSVSQH
jgi:catechol 2,3-dioxygenase-like lactoylglutathione lyase family enzyme